MDKFFNTAGPCKPELHYVLPPLARVNLSELESLIAAQKYFVLHAPRQTGKTTCLLALEDHLNRRGEVRALYGNVEAAQAARENVAAGLRVILATLAERAATLLGDSFLLDRYQGVIESAGAEGALHILLSRWARSSVRPVVLLLDEVDALVGDTLISVLRQLRAGYADRPSAFPQTVVLCGVRDVRDYRIHSSVHQEIITGGSAFNIKAESLRLGDFTRNDLEALYGQHTAATGQAFVAEALAWAWEQTRGQPWLVNALAYEACFRLPAGRDRARPISLACLETARENLILRRETHLDQLTDKLREERVRRVIEPMLAGQTAAGDFQPDDIQYTVDLGLIRREVNGALSIANRIYHEVIPRELTADTQSGLHQQPGWYVGAEGRLDLVKLLAAFQTFFRENSEAWLERFNYREAGPHLLLQAFLQRIVNGGGRIERQYALGRRRVDLLVRWPVGRGAEAREQKAVIELKVVRHSREATLTEGLEQTVAYAEGCGAEEAHLLLFERRPGVGWSERIFSEERACGGYTVRVWGM
jgi:hypothetical protein